METISALYKWCQTQPMIPQHDDDNDSPNQHHPQGEKSEITQSLSCSTSNKISILLPTSKDTETSGNHQVASSKGANNQTVEESTTAATTKSTRTTITTVGTNNQTSKTKPPKVRSALSTGYIVVDRAAPIKRRKRGKLTYSKMK